MRIVVKWYQVKGGESMKVKQTFSLEQDLLKQLKVEAVNNGIAYSDLVEKAIKEYLNKG